MKIEKSSYYHWIVAIVALIQLAVYGGIINNLSSLYIIPITEDLQISRGSVALAFSLRSMTSFFSILFSGAITRRFGFRPLSSIATALAAGCFCVLSASQNVVTLGIGAALMGMCEGFTTTAAACRIVSNWFHKHQGTILGFVTSSTGIGGSIFCVILSGITQAQSWRVSYLFAAGIIMLTAVLYYIVVREHPSHLGLRPYGEGTLPSKKQAAVKAHWMGYSMQQIVKKPTFYLMIFATFMSCVCNYVAFYVISPHMQDCGLSSSQGASLQSIMLLSMAGAKFFFGFLCDRIGAKKVTLICISLCAVSLFLMSIINGYPLALAAVIVFSFSLPITTITIPLLSAQLFGYQAHSNLVGIFISLSSVAALLCTTFTNTLYDILGSYKPVFSAFSIISIGVAAVYLVLFQIAGKDRKRHEANLS